MERDFTLKLYRKLCEKILQNNFLPVRVDEYIAEKNISDNPKMILRHDVDRLPNQALKMAKIENDLGITSTYYFRSIGSVFKEDLIVAISNLGHEIGYHYEVLANNNGDKKKALIEFENTLQKFRSIVEIKTICMHGSPLSQWKDSDIWLDNDFEDYGIIGETFLSIDYNCVRYFTDTGRKWNAEKYNVRDTVSTNLKNISLKNTKELIEFFPSLITDVSLNTHPHRWHDSYSAWFWEYVSQNSKNIGKIFLKKRYQ